MWFYIILSVIAILVILILCNSFFLFHFMFSRPKRSKKIPKYYIGSPHYNVSRKGMKYMETVPCEDIYITSHDGLKLHAYFFPAKEKSNKTVLGVHGYRSYARPEFGPYIEFYHSLGYNMLLPDDRAHAPSEGKYIGFGVLDRLDCIDFAKYLVKRFGENTQILLHGVSMGGATVLAASGEKELPCEVKGIISDCGYSKALDIIKYQFKNTIHMPIYPVLPLMEKISKRKAGFGFDEFSPIDQVKKSKVPILFVQGLKDKMVPPYMAEELYNACASRKKLLKVENAGHAESIALAPEEYHKAIREFFSI